MAQLSSTSMHPPGQQRSTAHLEAEGCLELWVRDVCLGHAQTCGPDEALILWRLAGEARAHKCDLGDHALPALLLTLAGLEHLEHLVLCHGAHLVGVGVGVGDVM